MTFYSSCMLVLGSLCVVLLFPFVWHPLLLILVLLVPFFFFKGPNPAQKLFMYRAETTWAPNGHTNEHPIAALSHLPPLRAYERHWTWGSSVPTTTRGGGGLCPTACGCSSPGESSALPGLARVGLKDPHNSRNLSACWRQSVQPGRGLQGDVHLVILQEIHLVGSMYFLLGRAPPTRKAAATLTTPLQQETMQPDPLAAKGRSWQLKVQPCKLIGWHLGGPSLSQPGRWPGYRHRTGSGPPGGRQGGTPHPRVCPVAGGGGGATGAHSPGLVPPPGGPGQPDIHRFGVWLFLRGRHTKNKLGLHQKQKLRYSAGQPNCKSQRDLSHFQFISFWMVDGCL